MKFLFKGIFNLNYNETIAVAVVFYFINIDIY